MNPPPYNKSDIQSIAPVSLVTFAQHYPGHTMLANPTQVPLAGANPQYVAVSAPMEERDPREQQMRADLNAGDIVIVPPAMLM